MKVIGITGGVGAGKSQVLSFIEEQYVSRIILADLVAHELEQPGQACYDKLVALLGRDVLQEDLQINKQEMAKKIFADEALLAQVNAIIHPAVKKYIIEQIQLEREKNELDFLCIEAALLIEEHYDEIVDEMWYIYASEKTRAERLAQNRNYSAEKIQAIMKKQLGEEDFRKHCSVVIINDGNIEETYHQIEKQMSK